MEKTLLKESLHQRQEPESWSNPGEVHGPNDDTPTYILSHMNSPVLIVTMSEWSLTPSFCMMLSCVKSAK